MHRYLLLFCLMPWAAWATPERVSLPIQTKHGRVTFQVEVARTPQEQAQGLMHRKHIPAGTGMLFDFGKPQLTEMWMKDTPSSLDMLFIDKHGKIVHMVQRTKPNSTRRLSSISPVMGVLELPAGTVQRKGISLNDTVTYPSFRP